MAVSRTAVAAGSRERMNYHASSRRSASYKSTMSLRPRVVGALLAAVVAASTLLRAADGSDELRVEPRIVEATLGRVSLEQVDLSLRVALRASQAATIRSIAFTDAFVGQVPVWIERVEGAWPLQPGLELVIPEPVRVRIHPRDALGADDLGAIVRKGTVTVRASVEVAIATPWLARLLFVGPTRTLVRDVVLEMPLPIGPSHLAPLTRLGADLADAAQRGAAAWFATGLDHLPRRSAMVLRFGGAVAGVTTRYGVEGGATPALRERRAAGVWWSPGVFCTTREALEPWRYDVGDATALQLRGARLRREGGTVHVGATREHPGVNLDLDGPRAGAAIADGTQAPYAGRRPAATTAARRSRRHRQSPVPADSRWRADGVRARRPRSGGRKGAGGRDAVRRRGVLARTLARRRLDDGHAGPRRDAAHCDAAPSRVVRVAAGRGRPHRRAGCIADGRVAGSGRGRGCRTPPARLDAGARRLVRPPATEPDLTSAGRRAARLGLVRTR